MRLELTSLEDRTVPSLVATSTSLRVDSDTVTYGQSITLTATIDPADGGSPTGSVQFSDADGFLGTQMLMGDTASLTVSLPAGNPAITATYCGDSNYASSSSAALDETVNPAPLTITAADVTATYGAPGLLWQFSDAGLVGDDWIGAVQLTTNASLSSSGNWAAGTWTITPNDPTGIVLTNYDITYQTGTLTVTPAAVNLFGFSASDKVYDSTTTATITSDGMLSGIVPGDSAALDDSCATASFSSPDVGTGIAVTATGYALTGADAGDYTVNQPNTFASITPAPLTIAANNQTRPYGCDSYCYTSTGLLGSDGIYSVQFSSDASTSTSGTWTVGTWTLTPCGSTGWGLSNYSITYQSGSLTIVPRELTDTGFTVADKAYDGTTSATIASDGTLVGVIPGDDVSLDDSGATASFADPLVGNSKLAIASGYTLAGADAANYGLLQVSTGSGKITTGESTVLYWTDALGDEQFASAGNWDIIVSGSWEVSPGAPQAGDDLVYGVSFPNSSTDQNCTNMAEAGGGDYNSVTVESTYTATITVTDSFGTAVLVLQGGSINQDGTGRVQDRVCNFRVTPMRRL